MQNNCEKIFHRNQTVPVNSFQSTFSAYSIYNIIRSSCIRIRCLKIFLILIIIGFFTPKTYSQTEIDYAIHANIVYRFTKYIDWPVSKKRGDFIIGIVGDSPLYKELKNFIANKRVGTQKIVLKQFPASQLTFDCHILFITEDKRNSLKKIAASTKGSSTLLVSESDGLARKGSCINFVVIEDHIKLEINKTNIEERDLSIATELLSLGILIK